MRTCWVGSEIGVDLGRVWGREMNITIKYMKISNNYFKYLKKTIKK